MSEMAALLHHHTEASSVHVVSSETTVLPIIWECVLFLQHITNAAAAPSSGLCSTFPTVGSSGPASVHLQAASPCWLRWSSPEDRIQPKIILRVYRVCACATLLKGETCLIRENTVKTWVGAWKRL